MAAKQKVIVSLVVDEMHIKDYIECVKGKSCGFVDLGKAIDFLREIIRYTANS